MGQTETQSATETKPNISSQRTEHRFHHQTKMRAVVGNQILKNSTLMKYKLVSLVFLFQFLFGFINGQKFETKRYNLKGFGKLSIPNILDTLGQDVSKRYIIENTLDNISKSGKSKVETKYQIDVTKMYLSIYDSDVVMFWPNYTLLNLLSFNNFDKATNGSSSDSILSEFSILPNILLQKKQFIYSSAQIKKACTKKEDQDKFANGIGNTLTEALKTLYPTITISNIFSNYFNYLGNYPAIKISINYNIPESEESTNFSQDIYSIYKNNSNYMFRFEYKSIDFQKWKMFEDVFLKELTLL